MTAVWRAAALALLGVLCAAPTSSQTIRTLPLRVTALVAEPISGRLYAALPGNAGTGANSVVAIDPVTGTVGSPVPVGSEPRILAPTDDGQFLYVGLDGASAIRRVDLSAGVAGPLYSLTLANAFDEPAKALVITPVPGAPATVLVVQSAYFNPNWPEVVVYDDGVPRPVRLGEAIDSIVAIDATTFLGSTSRELLRLRLDATGLTVTDRQPVPLGPPRLQIAANGVVFAEGGYVYDAGTLRLVRRQQLPSPYTEQQRAAPAQGRTYRLARGRLFAHDLETFDIRETVTLQAAHGTPQSLVPLGAGVAYHTNLPAVVLVGDFSGRPPAPMPSPVSARIDLTGCVDCQVGMPFRAAVTLVNVAATAQRVEVKAGIRTPGGDVLSTVFGGPHALIDVAPGTHTVELLAGVVPPGVVGQWRIDVVLVEPVSGRTLVSASREFRVTVF